MGKKTERGGGGGGSTIGMAVSNVNRANRRVESFRRPWCPRLLLKKFGSGFLRLAGPHENLPAGTKLEYFALATVRLARVATAATVPDEPVTPVCPMLARNELHQIQLNLHRILVFCKAKPLR